MDTPTPAPSGKKTTAVIYGTLSETLVVPSVAPLPTKLSSLRRRFGYLVNDFREQRITRHEFKLALVALTDVDDQGVEWTIGARTGQFYRRSGGGWELADPSLFGHASSEA